MPSGDINNVFSQVGQITGIQPTAIGQNFPGSIFIIEITAYHTRPPEIQGTDLPLGTLTPRREESLININIYMVYIYIIKALTIYV